MDIRHILKDRVVLVVDDENDVTDTIEEVLDMCFVRKTGFFEGFEKSIEQSEQDDC